MGWGGGGLKKKFKKKVPMAIKLEGSNDLGQKRYLGQRMLLEVWAGGGGPKLQVRGGDTYPVNNCIYWFIV